MSKRLPLLVLLGATAALYGWGLDKDGWANSFYSAAVQAGSQSWKAFFFGSSDAANSITVDKTPGALWIMDIAARIFGVNSWSILVPEALEGVGSVWLLYATVRRWFGEAPALIAGSVLALTPVATLMFRFNNPDALLVLLLIAATYATTRALDNAGTKWIVLAGMFIGLAFLAKMLQAFLIVPALGMVYLLSAPTAIKRRVWQLGAALAAVLVAGGWWVLIVELWPKSSRPYIGGSQTNSVLDLMFGYNGFGRLSGNENGSVGGGAMAGGGNWGPTGITRLFNDQMGTQVSWLIPAALILLVVAAGVVWPLPIRRRAYQAFGLWGGWLIVTGLAFSFGQGIIHPYYTVALTPAVGALVGIGSFALWKCRHNIVARIGMAIALAVTTWWSYVLLDRTNWNNWLNIVVLVFGLGATGMFLGAQYLRGKLVALLILVAVIGGMSGPTAYALQTASVGHNGSIPSAGPGENSGFGPGGATPKFAARRAPGSGTFGGQRFRNFGGQGLGGITGGPGLGQPGRLGMARGNGLLNASTPSKVVVNFLKSHKGKTTWVLATVGSNDAAGYQLSTGLSVMPVGGFNGSDPSPTLAQFQKLVAEGKIGYFLGESRGGFGPQMGGSMDAQEITSWVQQNFKTISVGNVTFYDLTDRSVDMSS